MTEALIGAGIGLFLGFCIATFIAVSKERDEPVRKRFEPRSVRRSAPEPAHRMRVKTNAPNNGELVRVRAAQVRGKYRRKM